MSKTIRVWLSILLSIFITVSSEEECGLYLALSSTATAEDSTWGIYAGKDIPAKNPIGFPDVGINMPHLKANSYFAEGEDEEAEEFLGQIVDFLESNIWVPGPAGALFEVSKGRSTSAIPGAGALAAFNAKLTNAEWNGTAAYVKPYWGEEMEKTHPNRGAISPFYHVMVQSKVDIPAGSEIFMDYGENWANDEEESDLHGEDWKKLDETVDDMIQFFQKHEGKLDTESKQQIYNFLLKEVMNAAVGVDKAHRITGILPSEPDELYKVKEAGGALKYSEPNVFRSIEWLKQYGRCMDNIKPGPSTIPNAGRGAFATRKISTGGLVAPVPLVHIPDSIIFDMHELTLSDDGDYMRESNDVVHKQLLLNYVYGHPESSMVFYPTGSAVSFINHSDEPNAKLVWSDHPRNSKLWFEMEPAELISEEYQHIGLLMEIVATKEISEGEEIFIDYGKEWKEAWDEHTKRFKKLLNDEKIPSKWPVRAVDMNNMYQSTGYKTKPELENDPYPGKTLLAAFIVVKASKNTGATKENPQEWGFRDDNQSTSFHHDQLRLVEIVERRQIEGSNQAAPYTYLVKTSTKTKKAIYIDNVPHEVIFFVDAPGTGDQFFQDSFRHYIGIPDEIFPASWKDLNEEDSISATS